MLTDRLDFAEQLNIRENAFTGTLPKSLSQLSKLGKPFRCWLLFLSRGDTCSNIVWIWSCENFPEYVIADHNHFSGTLHSSWADASSLKSLLVHGNTLVSSIPPAWGNLSYLEDLWLDHNVSSLSILLFYVSATSRQPCLTFCNFAGFDGNSSIGIVSTSETENALSSRQWTHWQSWFLGTPPPS